MILWIDPGIRKLGYALITKDLTIVDAGILLLDQDSPSRDDQFHRMTKIYDFFEKFIQEHQIDTVCIEKLFFTKYNQSNAEFVYSIRGALCMLFVKHNIQIREYTPLEVKKRITGHGKAEKIMVQQFIMKIFWLSNLPAYADSADALWLAYLWKF